MLSEYAIQNITRTLKASQEYSENDDLGEFLKLLDATRWRKYPEEKPRNTQRILVSIDGYDPILTSYNEYTWFKYDFETVHWIPVPEVNHEV